MCLDASDYLSRPKRPCSNFDAVLLVFAALDGPNSWIVTQLLPGSERQGKNYSDESCNLLEDVSIRRDRGSDVVLTVVKLNPSLTIGAVRDMNHKCISVFSMEIPSTKRRQGS